MAQWIEHGAGERVNDENVPCPKEDIGIKNAKKKKEKWRKENPWPIREP